MGHGTRDIAQKKEHFAKIAEQEKTWPKWRFYRLHSRIIAVRNGDRRGRFRGKLATIMLSTARSSFD